MPKLCVYVWVCSLYILLLFISKMNIISTLFLVVFYSQITFSYKVDEIIDEFSLL